MLSSRCSDRIDFQGGKRAMSTLRRAIKQEVEGIRFAGQQLFEVWIHEDESVAAGDQDAWDTCMSKSKSANLFLVLFNGNSGWPGTSEQVADKVGVCHAELIAAFNQSPGKVRLIQFPPIRAKAGSPDQRFQRYFDRQGLIGVQVNTG